MKQSIMDGITWTICLAGVSVGLFFFSRYAYAELVSGDLSILLFPLSFWVPMLMMLFVGTEVLHVRFNFPYAFGMTTLVFFFTLLFLTLYNSFVEDFFKGNEGYDRVGVVLLLSAFGLGSSLVMTTIYQTFFTLTHRPGRHPSPPKPTEKQES